MLTFDAVTIEDAKKRAGTIPVRFSQNTKSTKYKIYAKFFHNDKIEEMSLFSSCFPISKFILYFLLEKAKT